jgi:multimeric flavodoxin WrbA
VIQGSPRADGNCSIIAEWCADEVLALEKTVQVLYIDDMEIAPCIGCYQCYNTGTCTFDDDMDGIIRVIRDCSLLVVCTPVYTNTVPGGLKLLIDRCQAYHAERSFRTDDRLKHGLLFSVAGRKGKENFACVTKVVRAYLHNLGITPAGEVLVDGLDVIRDIRTIGGLEEQVRSTVRRCSQVVELRTPGGRRPS